MALSTQLQDLSPTEGGDKDQGKETCLHCTDTDHVDTFLPLQKLIVWGVKVLGDISPAEGWAKMAGVALVGHVCSITSHQNPRIKIIFWGGQTYFPWLSYVLTQLDP